MPNRLASSTSPYLLQHKDNPVDWWEWGPEAFTEARRRDVPVLLSVGYAACHWCHVMAHESFENEETARLMNRRYVNVKVDREERPDVDAVYMEAVQAMTGQGGWPMTVWLDHEGRPFFAGTYFPASPRHGMATFAQVMEAVSTAWEERREDVTDQATRLVAAISRDLPPGDPPGEGVLETAYQEIASAYDPIHGGFGRAPKFPQAPVLDFLLRISDETWAGDARAMVENTLQAMAAGGIHDQLGGGFARYSVDNRWLVPHFEKMLYDNAQLARVYLWAGIEFGRRDFLEVARSTLDYLARDLRHPEGGFFSSEDADSEGVEGKFYVWDQGEITEVLGDLASEVIDYFGVTPQGNFEGSNILHVAGDTVPPRLDEARQALLARREQRVRPGLDDKVVTSWNGLAIRALAEAGSALAEPTYLDLAAGAASFIADRLMVGGRLMRSWREGSTSVPGFLEDHAAMAVASFALYAATAAERWYRLAMEMVGRLDSFWGEDGLLYTTGEDHDALVKRPRDVADNPTPSGNALAAEAWLIASLYTGEDGLEERARRALSAAGLLGERYPTMVGHHLAVAHSASDTRELAVVGPDWSRFSSVYWARYRPSVALAASPGGKSEVPLLEGREPVDGTRAFLCRGFVCDLPVSEPAALAAQLDG